MANLVEETLNLQVYFSSTYSLRHYNTVLHVDKHHLSKMSNLNIQKTSILPAKKKKTKKKHQFYSARIKIDDCVTYQLTETLKNSIDWSGR